MRTIAIANQNGVGKTTSTINIGAGLNPVSYVPDINRIAQAPERKIDALLTGA